MGIYDGIDFGGDKLHAVALAAIALLVVGVLVYVVSNSNSQPGNPLEVSFQKNPMKATETNVATVKIVNNTKEDLANVVVTLSAKEKSEVQIFSTNPSFRGNGVTIPVLSAGTSREITFMVNPNDSALPGTYSIVAQTEIGGTSFEKEEKLTIN